MPQISHVDRLVHAMTWIAHALGTLSARRDPATARIFLDRAKRQLEEVLELLKHPPALPCEVCGENTELGRARLCLSCDSQSK